MSTDVTSSSSNAIQVIAKFSDKEKVVFNALKNSLYPGAKDESVLMVLDYCSAAKLDPMQKPVHIVPMNVKTGRKDANNKDIYEWRDVIMPGIGQYRTNAVNTKVHAGTTEPEFGEDVTENFPEEKVTDYYNNNSSKTRPALKLTYPRWCKVTVKRKMEDGTVIEFTAKELWKENYATLAKDSSQPNAMWQKRPYAQLAKCTEAQALRKAFPEFGAQPTAEEMEGKNIDYETYVEITEPTVSLSSFEKIVETLTPLGIKVSYKDGYAIATGGKITSSQATLNSLGFKFEDNQFKCKCTQPQSQLPAPSVPVSSEPNKKQAQSDLFENPVINSMDSLFLFADELGLTLSDEFKMQKQDYIGISGGNTDGLDEKLIGAGFAKSPQGKWIRPIADLKK